MALEQPKTFSNSSFSQEQIELFGSYRPRWQQTMLRISSLEDVRVLEELFGFSKVDEYHFPEWKFSLYFLATLSEEQKSRQPTPGSKEAHQWLWSTDMVTLELTHNHDSEEQYISGNVEPHRGFGHIAVNVDDVYATCDKLEAAGLKFQKKPDDGRMKGLAFALMPTGYWVEIIRGVPPQPLPAIFSQTMLRVKDPKLSVPFYRDLFGMTLVQEKHFPEAKFSLYFMASLTPEQAASRPADAEALNQWVKALPNPVLELTHNHGTESDPEFHYWSGNEEGHRGFGHIGFLVDNLVEACQQYEAAGVRFKKRPHEGMMKQLAFLYDPDQYWVEVIQRGADM